MARYAPGVRARILIMALLVVVAAIAATGCRRHRAKHPARQPDRGYEPTPGYAADPAPTYAGEGTTGTVTCNEACAHYLACKGVADPGVQADCVSRCVHAKYSPQILASFVQTDCASAIAIVEGQQKAGGGGGGATGKECQGCVWDGSSCIWMSSSNWGSGPYSGAWTSCNAYCCPGH